MRRTRQPRFRTAAARKLFLDEQFCRSDDSRIEAVSEVVSDVGRSTADIETLLMTKPHRYSYEVHFTIWNFLPWPPSESQQLREWFCALARRYLTDTPTQAAFAAWLAGDALAHWAQYGKSTEEHGVLIDCALHARFVAGRKGALHGIEHALNHASRRGSRTLLDTVVQVLRSDKSTEVRDYALLILTSGGCWDKEKASPELKRLASRVARHHVSTFAALKSWQRRRRKRRPQKHRN